jgi:hypothetical protein
MMLGPQASLFIEENFSNLRVIGWVDPDENISNPLLAQMMISGVIIVSCINHLRQVIHSYRKIKSKNRTSIGITEQVVPQEPEKLEYELSNDEVNALLGVE